LLIVARADAGLNHSGRLAGLGYEDA
jgi:hypothetical protein